MVQLRGARNGGFNYARFDRLRHRHYGYSRPRRLLPSLSGGDARAAQARIVRRLKRVYHCLHRYLSTQLPASDEQTSFEAFLLCDEATLRFFAPTTRAEFGTNSWGWPLHF